MKNVGFKLFENFILIMEFEYNRQLSFRNSKNFKNI